MPGPFGLELPLLWGFTWTPQQTFTCCPQVWLPLGAGIAGGSPVQQDAWALHPRGQSRLEATWKRLGLGETAGAKGAWELTLQLVPTHTLSLSLAFLELVLRSKAWVEGWAGEQ